MFDSQCFLARKLSAGMLLAGVLVWSAANIAAQTPDPAVDVHWIGGSGDWTDPANWSTDFYPRNDHPEPGDRYHAIIDAGGDYTVALDASVAIDNLTIDAPGATLRHTGGTLSVAQTLAVLQGEYDLAGGRLSDARLATPEPGSFSISASHSVLRDVTLDSTVEALIPNGFILRVENDLTLDNATVRLFSTGSTTRLRFYGGGEQHLLGTGQVVFDGTTGSDTRALVDVQDFTVHVVIAEGITIRSGQIGGAVGRTGSNRELTNHGTIAARTPGRVMQVWASAGNFTNHGVLEALNGGSVVDVQDDYTVGTAMSVGLGGPSTAEHGRVTVDGTATLEGTLIADFIDGYAPQLGDRFTILTAGNIDGVFDTVDVPEAEGEPLLDVVYHADAVELQVIDRIPLPATDPFPEDGAENMVTSPLLSWSEGGFTSEFEVYFGTNPIPGAAEFQGAQSAVETTFDPGTLDWDTTYYWRVDALNAIGTTEGPVWSFTTRPEPVPDAPVVWLTGDGSWSEAANWSSSPHIPNNDFPDPGDRYSVRIDAAGDYTVTLDADVTIDQLVIDAPGATLRHTGGTLTVLGELQVLAGTFEFAGGRLAAATVLVGEEGALSVAADSRLADVILGTGADVRVPNGRTIAVDGDLTLDGTTIHLESTGSNTGLQFDDGDVQHVAGTGTILFGGSSDNNRVEPSGAGSHLVVGDGVSILSDARGGTIGNAANPLTNHGLISARTGGRTVTVLGEGVVNEGNLEAVDGATLHVNALAGNLNSATLAGSGSRLILDGDSYVLNEDFEVRPGTRLTLRGDSTSEGVLTVSSARIDLAGTWQNTGSLILSGSLLDLAGTFRFSDLGTIERTGGTVRLRGTLDNTGETMTLDASTGTWEFDGGRIEGGVLASADGETLDVTSSSVLQDVTLDASFDLSIPNGQLIDVEGDLTLDGGVVRLQSTGSTTRLRFADGTEQHLLGTGTIIFDGTTGLDSRNRVEPQSGSHLVIAAGVTVRSGQIGGRVGHGSHPLTNHGTIAAQTFGRTLEVTADPFLNTGSLAATGGAHLDVSGLAEEVRMADITLLDEGSRVILAGDYTIDHEIELSEPGTRLTLAGATADEPFAVTLDGARLDLSGPDLVLGSVTATGATLSMGGTWSHDGTIAAANSTIALGGDWTNSGLVTVDGGSLSLSGSWANTGVLDVTSATVAFGGAFSVSDLDGFQRTGGVVTVTGSLDLAQERLGLDAATGSWNLDGATIRDGSLAVADGATFDVAGNFTLRDVVLDGSVTLEIPNGQTVTVANDLTLAGATVRLQSTGSTTLLSFNDGATQNLGGSGQVVFDGATGRDDRNRIDVASGGHLIVAEGITIRSNFAGGRVGLMGRALTNHGRILSQTQGRMVEIRGNDPFINHGGVEAIGGGRILVRNFSENHGSVTAGPGSRIDVESDYPSGTTLQVGIAGAASADHGRVLPDRTAQLSGLLELSFVDGYIPVAGDRFDIIVADAIAGTFDAVETPDLPADTNLELIYGSQVFSVLVSGMPPFAATQPFPSDGAENVMLTPTLTWKDGGLASRFEVYFGTDPDPGFDQFQGEHVDTHFEPGTLETATTYYWRIDAVNDFGTTPGSVWSFTTEPDRGAIAGVVWNDEDGDAERDPGEPLLEGWQVYLDLNDNARRDSGEPIRVTDENGAFAFTGLLHGTYVVRQIVPPEWEQTYPAGGAAHVVELSPGETAEIAFGNWETAPAVIAASGNRLQPVGTRDDYRLTLRFDRSMDPDVEPQIAFVDEGAQAAPDVPSGGTWSRHTHTNDRYRTPPITLSEGMDGTFEIHVSDARDPAGRVMDPAVVKTVVVDVTPPPLPDLAVIAESENAVTVGWDGYDAPDDLDRFRVYRHDEPFANVTGVPAIATLGSAARQYAFSNLELDRDYHVAIQPLDLAGNRIAEIDSFPIRIDSHLPPPVDLTVSAPGLERALLDWSGYDTAELFGFAGFHVYHEGAPFDDVSGLAPIALLGPDARQHVVGGLDREADHYFAVVGFNRLDAFDPAVTAVPWTDPLAEAIVADTTIGGPGEPDVLISESLAVREEATLTILPGTTVRFAEGSGLVVEEGSLMAEGTALEPIVFTSEHDTAAGSPSAGDWAGVILETGGSGSSVAHVYLQYGGGLDVQAGAPAIEAFTALFNTGAGLRAGGDAAITTADAWLAFNETGVLQEDDAAIEITNSVIRSNSMNAEVTGTATLDARGNWWGSEEPAAIDGAVSGSVNTSQALDREPVLTPDAGVAGGVTQVGTREIELVLAGRNAESVRVSEDSSFAGVFFDDFEPVEPFTLSEGAGAKEIFVQFRSLTGHASDVISFTVEFVTEGPEIVSFNLSEGDEVRRPFVVEAQATAALGLQSLAFAVDGEVLASTGADGVLEHRWDVREHATGIRRISLIARDQSGNLGVREHNVVLGHDQPPAPAITAPLEGILLAKKTVDVTGAAEPFVEVRLARNGLFMESVTADAEGTFVFESVELVEDENRLVASARDAIGSTSSPVRTVFVDTAPPVALVMNEPLYFPDNKSVQASWRFPDEGQRARTFQVLWDTEPFDNPDDAANASSETEEMELFFTNLPNQRLHFAVVGFDTAGNRSPLSNLVSIDFDDRPPVLAIAYDKISPVGPGPLGITVTSDEPLAGAPSLVLRFAGMAGGVPVDLEQDDIHRFVGAVDINATAASGPVDVRAGAMDLAGNVFQGVPAGPELVVDVTPPVASITTDPTPPVQTLEETAVAVQLALTKPHDPGSAPELAFDPPEGDPIAIVLEGEGTEWTGILTLGLEAGTGIGRFQFSGTDAFGNTGTRIDSGVELEIFADEDPPPPGAPQNLVAETLPGGEIRLQWVAAENAETYTVYRESGAAGDVPALAVASGIEETEYIDLPEEDGIYRYAVRAERMGVEGDPSNVVPAESNRTPPPAPVNVAVELGPEGVRITWEQPSGDVPVARFHVYRNGERIRTVSTVRRVNDAPPRGVIQYTVGAADAIGNEAVSDAATIELFVGAPGDLIATVRHREQPWLTWTSGDETTTGYNLYRNGVLQNDTPLIDTEFLDPLPTGDERVRYAVRAVNAEGQESPPRTVDVFPVLLDLIPNPDEEMEPGPLRTRYFDRFHAEVVNQSTFDPLSLEAWKLTRHIAGEEPFELHHPLHEPIDPGAARAEEIVLPGALERSEQTVVFEAIHESDVDGSEVLYERVFHFDEVRSPGTMVSVTALEQPLAGGLASFDVRVHNRSDVPIEFIAFRNFGEDPGDAYLSVLDEFGDEMRRVSITTAPDGTIMLSGGIGLTVIQPGSAVSFTVENVLTPISLAESGATYEVVVPQIYHDFGWPTELAAGPLEGHMFSSLAETPYHAAAQTPQLEFTDDEVITITGTTLDRDTDEPVGDVPVRIGFSSRGYHWFREVEADADGNFALDYRAPAGFGGVLNIWATHPDIVDQLNQVEVVLYRMFATPGRGEVRMSKNDFSHFSIRLVNPNDADLTGVEAQFRAFEVVNGEEIEIETIQGGFRDGGERDIRAGARERVNLEIEAAIDAPDAAQFEFVFASAEGATTRFSGTMELLPAFPIVTVTRPRGGFVETSLDRGAMRSREVTIENRGLRPLEGIEIVPPQEHPWIRLNLPVDEDGIIRIPDLEIGESHSFTVVFTPPDTLEPDHYQDRVTIRGDNLPSDFDLNLFAQITSDLTGSVQFYVSSILGQPVPGARIRMRNVFLQEEIGPFVTGEDGLVAVDGLHEGDWSWQTTAPGHSSDHSIVTVIPDQVVEARPRLSRSLVTINFQVEPVPFTDRYEIVIEQQFETHVPAPVMVVDPAVQRYRDIRPGFEDVYIVTVKNEGLIEMFDLQIEPAESTRGKLEPLIDYIPVLAAMQEIEIPYRFVYHGPPEAQGGGGAEGSGGGATPMTIVPPDPVFADDEGFPPTGVQCIDDGVQALIEPGMKPSDMLGLSSALNANFRCVDDDSLAGAGAFAVGFGMGASIVSAPISVLATVIHCIGQALTGGSKKHRKGQSVGRGRSQPAHQSSMADFTGLGPECFAEGTEVAVAGGETRPIEELAPGDVVKTGANAVAAVRNVFSREVDTIVRIRFRGEDGSKGMLATTPEHLIWHDGEGWVFAATLQEGDWLHTKQDELVEIVSVERVEETQTVHTIDLESARSLYANGILVHDLCGRWDGGPVIGSTPMGRIEF